jgi:hypothetical protein
MDALAEPDMLGDKEAESEAEVEGDDELEMDGESEADGLEDAEEEIDLEIEGETELDGLGLALGEADIDADGVALADTLTLGDTLADADEPATTDTCAAFVVRAVPSALRKSRKLYCFPMTAFARDTHHWISVNLSDARSMDAVFPAVVFSTPFCQVSWASAVMREFACVNAALSVKAPDDVTLLISPVAAARSVHAPASVVFCH